jgi:hypothetical protein
MLTDRTCHVHDRRIAHTVWHAIHVRWCYLALHTTSRVLLSLLHPHPLIVLLYLLVGHHAGISMLSCAGGCGG